VGRVRSHGRHDGVDTKARHGGGTRQRGRVAHIGEYARVRVCAWVKDCVRLDLGSGIARQAAGRRRSRRHDVDGHRRKRWGSHPTWADRASDM
jgi:hypothetical protein